MEAKFLFWIICWIMAIHNCILSLICHPKAIILTSWSDLWERRPSKSIATKGMFKGSGAKSFLKLIFIFIRKFLWIYYNLNISSSDFEYKDEQWKHSLPFCLPIWKSWTCQVFCGKYFMDRLQCQKQWWTHSIPLGDGWKQQNWKYLRYCPIFDKPAWYY